MLEPFFALGRFLAAFCMLAAFVGCLFAFTAVFWAFGSGPEWILEGFGGGPGFIFRGFLVHASLQGAIAPDV